MLLTEKEARTISTNCCFVKADVRLSASAARSSRISASPRIVHDERAARRHERNVAVWIDKKRGAGVA